MGGCPNGNENIIFYSWPLCWFFLRCAMWDRSSALLLHAGRSKGMLGYWSVDGLIIRIYKTPIGVIYFFLVKLTFKLFMRTYNTPLGKNICIYFCDEVIFPHGHAAFSLQTGSCRAGGWVQERWWPVPGQEPGKHVHSTFQSLRTARKQHSWALSTHVSLCNWLLYMWLRADGRILTALISQRKHPPALGQNCSYFLSMLAGAPLPRPAWWALVVLCTVPRLWAAPYTGEQKL